MLQALYQARKVQALILFSRPKKTLKYKRIRIKITSPKNHMQWMIL